MTDDAIDTALRDPKLFERVGDPLKAKSELGDLAVALAEDVKQNAQSANLDLVDEIARSLDQIKNRTIEKSDEALNILADSGKRFDAKVLKNAAEASKKKTVYSRKGTRW